MLCAAFMLYAAGCGSESVSSDQTAQPQGAAYSPDITAEDFKIELSSRRVTPYSEVVRYTITYLDGNSGKRVDYSGPVKLERLDGGTWREIDTAEPLSDTAEMFGFARRSALSLADELYEEPLTEGRYRVSKTVNEDILLSQEFDMVESELALELERTSFTTDDKSGKYTVKFIGDSDDGYMFGESYHLERLTDSGKWETVPFREGRIVHLIGYLVSKQHPENSNNFAINTDIYEKPLIAGRYRLVTDVSPSGERDYGNVWTDEILTAEFDLTEGTGEIDETDFGSSITWVYGGESINQSADEITTNTDKIKIRYSYNSALKASFSLDDSYELQKLGEDGEWHTVPTVRDFAGNASYNLGSEAPSFTQLISFADYYFEEPLTAGDYRVVKRAVSAEDGSVVELVTEFTMAEALYKEDGTPYLTESDIVIEITNTEPITTDTERIDLLIRYAGSAEYARYTYGSSYVLKKQSEETGEYEPVEFSDEGGIFTLLAYPIGTECRENSSAASLLDRLYAEPLTAGKYIIEKKIDDITFEIPFEMIEAAADVPADIPTDEVQPEASDTSEAPRYPEYAAESPALTESDILMEIRHEGDITAADGYLTLSYTYLGDAENAEYCFGEEYTLKRWSQEFGGWDEVKFAENAAFNSLGYLIGSSSRENSTTVSLSDDFYAGPLIAGTYMVEKPICDGVVLKAMFELKGVDGESGLVIESENGSITLRIEEIRPEGFVCMLPWPYPAVYEVVCDTSEYEGLCAGDNIEVDYAIMYKSEEFSFRVIPREIIMSDFELEEGVEYKPVIYLYPEAETQVSVKLDYNGELLVTDPEYGEGWSVTARPDGTIVTDDGTEYPYLFWEGRKNYEPDTSRGFCVSGADTERFLLEKLAYLGLSDGEAADFMEFWLPHMVGNPYNIIRFHGEDYTSNAQLEIDPAPDTVIRVYMSITPCGEFTEIEPPQLSRAPERSGFTVVEWGGSIEK